MKPWLDGDFGDMDPKADFGALRDLVQTAAHREIDLSNFWLGLAHRSPVACAELAVGPRAVAHPESVQSCLIILETLEKIIAPSGLYNRLVELGPSCRPRLAQLAALRHPRERWIWRLARGGEEPAGLYVLLAHLDTPHFEFSCRVAAKFGFVEALAQMVETSEMEKVYQAVANAGMDDTLAGLTRRALNHHEPERVTAVLCALLGPGFPAFYKRVAERTEDRQVHTALESQLTAFEDNPDTRSEFKGISTC